MRNVRQQVPIDQEILAENSRTLRLGHDLFLGLFDTGSVCNRTLDQCVEGH